jgi:ribosomal-protein-alanine N-acetyltransferase
VSSRRPGDPDRSEDFFAEDHQRRIVAEALAKYQNGTAVPLVIVENTEVVGRINVNDIVRGPFQSTQSA